MPFSQKFLEDLIGHGEATNEEGETAKLFTEIYVDTIEDLEHWKLIFQFEETFYQVPYIMCGEIRFNENLDKLEDVDIYQYIAMLSEKEWNPEALIECAILDDKSITLTMEETEKLSSESKITFMGEKIHLSGQLYSEEGEEFETFTYLGDSFGFSRELVDPDGKILCRTIPYIPALTFGVCGC